MTQAYFFELFPLHSKGKDERKICAKILNSRQPQNVNCIPIHIFLQDTFARHVKLSIKIKTGNIFSDICN